MLCNIVGIKSANPYFVMFGDLEFYSVHNDNTTLPHPLDPLHGDLTEEQLLLLAKSHGSCGQPSTSSGIEFTLDKNALKKKR